jgi:hypothetical protein
MIALFSLLTIIVLSIIVVRIGGIALELTGLSPEIASFQAQSAFSGAGFTTSEAEAMVNHPVRRRIIRILILLGGAGVTTSMATLVLTFMGETGKTVVLKGSILLLGLLVIFLLAQSKYIYNIMKKLISHALEKWTMMHVFDYEQILGFGEGYTISRVTVRSDSWLSDKKLSDLKLEQKGVLVLAIYRKVGRKEKFIGSLSGDTKIMPQDALVCYSRRDVSEILSRNETIK